MKCQSFLMHSVHTHSRCPVPHINVLLWAAATAETMADYNKKMSIAGLPTIACTEASS